MPESIISKRLIQQIENCIKKAAFATDVGHNGMAGQIREIFLAEIIRPILPTGFCTGTGKIIDRKGNLSKQTDIIIYNRSRFPPLMFDDTTGIFPIDSVYYSIEVKTKINASEIDDAITKAQAMRNLEGEQPHFAVFGFSTDITTAGLDLERIQKRQSEHETPPVGIYCSLGEGYCFYRNGKWEIFANCTKYAEVIGLVIGIVNTLVNSPPKAIDFAPGIYLGWWT